MRLDVGFSHLAGFQLITYFIPLFCFHVNSLYLSNPIYPGLNYENQKLPDELI